MGQAPPEGVSSPLCQTPATEREQLPHGDAYQVPSTTQDPPCVA